MSAWDTIVGIDLDLWMRAENNPVQIAWLAHLRDHPLPEQGLPHTCTCDLNMLKYTQYGRCPWPARPCVNLCTCERVDVPSMSTSFTASIPGRRDPDCLVHGYRPPPDTSWIQMEVIRG